MSPPATRQSPVERPADWLPALARFGREHLAFRFEGRSVDYAELARAVDAAAARLAAAGLEPGDLVAVLASPSLEGLATLHAMLAGGIVMLPLNQRSTPAEQGDALRASGARFLLHDANASVAETLDAECGLLSMVADEDGLSPCFEVSRAPSKEIEVHAAARRSARLAEGAALVLQTSGTSGRQKRAVLGFAQLLASARASAALLGSQASDRWLSCMPLFHIGGLSILVRSALVGASVVVQKSFDAEAVADALESESITRVSFVATMLERVLDVRGDARAPDALALVLLGGGPASSALLRRAEALGYPLAPTYGLTEAASQVATRPPHVSRSSSEPPSAGLRALPGVALRIVDESGRPVESGEPGEIELRGPIVMLGYLEDAAASDAAFREGWLRTGDVGVLDETGGLRVLDRRADLILSGGENVYPAEVESMLREAEGVADVGVFGRPDPRFGARPVAVVVMSEGADFDADALSAFCRERMAGYKCPVEFVRAADLPRTATGKLRRNQLGRSSS